MRDFLHFLDRYPGSWGVILLAYMMTVGYLVVKFA